MRYLVSCFVAVPSVLRHLTRARALAGVRACTCATVRTRVYAQASKWASAGALIFPRFKPRACKKLPAWDPDSGFLSEDERGFGRAPARKCPWFSPT